MEPARDIDQPDTGATNGNLNMTDADKLLDAHATYDAARSAYDDDAKAAARDAYSAASAALDAAIIAAVEARAAAKSTARAAYVAAVNDIHRAARHAADWED